MPGLNALITLRQPIAEVAIECLSKVDVPAISNYWREPGKAELPLITYMKPGNCNAFGHQLTILPSCPKACFDAGSLASLLKQLVTSREPKGEEYRLLLKLLQYASHLKV